MSNALLSLGWTEELSTQFRAVAADGAIPARVCRIDRGAAVVLTAAGTVSAPHTGTELAVGDWVVLRGERITGVLPRRTTLARADVSGAAVEQVVAANVDTVFVVASLEAPLRVSRLERYLAFAWSSGAAPVVVLSKADRCGDVPAALEQAAEVAVGVPVCAVSAYEPAGLAPLAPYVVTGRTAALVGPSGVGKSTIVNGLAGAEHAPTGTVRAYGKGRHTTAWRELIALPGGGMLLDTPGLRGLSLWESADGLDATFSDIVELAAGCRFSDCAHTAEPGCAVLAAVDAGALEAGRLARYRKMLREQAHLDARRDARARAEETARLRRRARAMRGRPHR